jgi:hypothetical protein
MIKKTLTLNNDKPNIFDLPQATIDSFSIDEADKELFISTVKIFSARAKSHPTNKYVKFHLDNNFKYIDIIRYAKYPLPAVYNKKTKRAIINISALQKRSVSNIDMRDLYTIMVYTNTCSVMSAGYSISDQYSDVVCQYMAFVFLKMFAKQYGITGDYLDRIPQLRFLVNLYINQSFFGMNKKTAIRKAANLAKFDPKRLEVDLEKYNMFLVQDLLQVLSDSEVTPGLTIYRFLEKMIKSFGIMNLSFFEDSMRFSCIMLSASVNGNSYFSPSFQMFNPKLYAKVISVIEHTINKAM